MNTLRQYAIDGYALLDVDHLASIDILLYDLMTKDLNNPFKWEQKYTNTLDLRPAAHVYGKGDYGSHPLIDCLFKSEIDRKITEFVAADAVLTHVQIRKSMPGPSYMDWHRDSYIYDDTIIGNFPPVHKIIYYPNFGGPSEPKLKLAKGSHRMHQGSLKDDLGLLERCEIVTYDSSDKRVVLFDTSIMHAVIPDSRPEGSIRVIYSFMRRQQYVGTLMGDRLHDDQVRLYESNRRWYDR